jgi:Tol biopolymer transport system component
MLILLALFWVPSDVLAKSKTTLINLSSTDIQGNDRSYDPSISANGRFVAFSSLADNLVGDDHNGYYDIFVHDRLMAETARVSVSSIGTQSNDRSFDPVISPDGRYVAFESAASNLVDGDSNNVFDIFVHDRQTRETTRVSVSSSGVQGNDFSYDPSISSDGRYVAFRSNADNLVDGDSNETWDIFMHDRQTGQTTRVSVSSTTLQANDKSYAPAVSSDGQLVAFSSDASNLVPGDSNGFADIFMHDCQLGQTTRISVSSTGNQGNGKSFSPSISSDGRYVAFESDAANLAADDSNDAYDVYVHDRQTGQTTRVSVSSKGEEGNDTSQFPSISSDGRYVAFMSNASNLVTNDSNNFWDTFVHDRQTDETTRVSVSSEGVQGNHNSYIASISSNGRMVAFSSDASNLVPGDSNQSEDIFLYKRLSGSLQGVKFLLLED